MLVRPLVFMMCWLCIPIALIETVISPLLIATIIDKMVAQQFEVVQSLILLVGGLLLANIALKVFWNHFLNIDGVVGAKYLHRHTFKHLLSLDYDFFSNQYTGALSSYQQRMTSAFIDFNNMVFIGMPAMVTVLVGSIVVLFIKSPLLGAITLICVLAISAVTAFGAYLRLGQRRDLAVQNGRLAGQLSDSLSHATTVKALAKEDREAKRFLGYVNDWAVSQNRIWRSYIYIDAIRTFLHVIMFVVILLASLALFKDGKIGVATVALVQLYTVRLLDSTVQIAAMIKRNEANMSDSYQMMKILQETATVTDPASPVKLKQNEPIGLNFNQVSFKYDSSSLQGDTLNDFSLSIKPGEKVGVVGPSGAGKTTLTKLILRFYDVTSGSITFNNTDIRDTSQSNLRSLIAYVPQEPLLFYRSIRENIAYANDQASSKDVEIVAGQANVTEFTQDLTDGLDTMVGERGVKLSGGQRQRVAIARAMLRNSPVLVLDEATSALDSETEKLIQDGLWKLMKGKTAIVIAHRLSTIQKMDRIVVVQKGHVVEEGSHQELLTKDGLYAKLWKHQSGGFLGEG